jgi:hypothetical protein
MPQTQGPLDSVSKTLNRASDSRKAWTSPHLRILPVVSGTQGGKYVEGFEGSFYRPS